LIRKRVEFSITNPLLLYSVVVSEKIALKNISSTTGNMVVCVIILSPKRRDIMAKWLSVVGTNCVDAAREAEFNRWYDEIHLPDVLETPGLVRATRYENTAPAEGQAKFLALYEIETDDYDNFSKAVSENMAKKRAQGRISELMVIVSRGVYKQISSVSR
jgi:hypothetical protein